MQQFMQRHGALILGVLTGFDRILFRGSFLTISHVKGMDRLMKAFGCPWIDFKPFVLQTSKTLKDHVTRYARQQGRPIVHLNSPAVCKEEVAQAIQRRDGITVGLIAVLTSVEQCQTFCVRGNRKTGLVELAPARRKCLFYYFYYLDAQFGLMHVRLQSWLPLSIQVCLNGREYLARRLDQEGIGYEKRDNCFVRLDDLPRAQALLDELLDFRWELFLEGYAHVVNPFSGATNPLGIYDYYWTFRQSEIATDVMFQDEASLELLYPHLVRHAVEQFDCPNLLRFLGRRNLHFRGKATTDRQCFPEGIRVKHRIDENSIKMYDKQGSVLRVETMIENPRRFYVYRPVFRGGQETMAWRHMRKGLADLRRRVDVSRAANERYLDALAVVGLPSPCAPLLDPVSRRIVRRGRGFRPLHPIDRTDSAIFAVLLNGDFLLQGFRNKDVRRRLFPKSDDDPDDRRRTAGQVTRLFALLRAHHLIRKVSHTFYYRVTKRGQQIMTTARRLREIDVAALAA